MPLMSEIELIEKYCIQRLHLNNIKDICKKFVTVLDQDKEINIEQMVKFIPEIKKEDLYNNISLLLLLGHSKE